MDCMLSIQLLYSLLFQQSPMLLAAPLLILFVTSTPSVLITSAMLDLSAGSWCRQSAKLFWTDRCTFGLLHTADAVQALIAAAVVFAVVFRQDMH
jgi:hypothetical protein